MLAPLRRLIGRKSQGKPNLKIDDAVIYRGVPAHVSAAEMGELVAHLRRTRADQASARAAENAANRVHFEEETEQRRR